MGIASLLGRKRQIRDDLHQSQITNPVHSLLRLLLSFGISQEAKSIGFGFRKNMSDVIPALPKDPLEQKRMREIDIQFGSTPEQCDAYEKRVQLRGPPGWDFMPVWILTSTDIYCLQRIQFGVFSALLSAAQERIVSIDGTKQNPQVPRYIEITPLGEHRRFVEVELEWDIENMFWIKLGKVRNTAMAVHLSNSSC